MPRRHRAAGSSTLLHLLQHASFTGTAVAALGVDRFGTPPPARFLVTVAGVACIGITGAVLGALLTFAPGSLTPGATTLDQQLAGVLLWAWGGLVSVGAAATVTLVALGRADRSVSRRSAPGAPAPVEP
ncbi:MAG: cytochrome c oxidase assembly protein [Acidimicrobiales bacterium]